MLMNLTTEDIMELLESNCPPHISPTNGDIQADPGGSVEVLNLFMEDHEIAIATVPPEMTRKIWKRYVDDLFEITKKDQRDPLAVHLNNIDPMGSIQFTDEAEVDKTIPFLDAQITRKMTEH